MVRTSKPRESALAFDNLGELTMSHLYLLGVATLTLTSAGFAGSDTNADLQARLDAAEARISELSAATNANWLNDARADEIRGLVHDVLADADTRASLQGSGATAGYNGGFTVGSADGNWSMTINGLLQTRWTNVDNDAAADETWGFTNNRSWLNFSGTIAGDYGYDVRHDLGTATANPNGNNGDWANGSLTIGDGWDLTMGSFKMASSREALIGDENQMALDRRANGFVGAQAVYNVGQGVSLDYSSDDLGVTIQVVDNAGVASAAANNSSYSYNVRVEYLASGSWGQFDQFHSAEGGAAGTLVGFSYTGNDNGNAAAGGTSDQNLWNLDVQMQWGGSALYVSYTDGSDGLAAANDFNQTQIMYSMDMGDNWEVYARWTDNDGDAGSMTSVGVNNYLAGQNAKWTTELTMDDRAAGAASDVTTIATQLQFYF